MRIRSPLLNSLLLRVAVFLLKLLYKTVRVRVVEAQPNIGPHDISPLGPYVYLFWHEELLHAVFARDTPFMAGLVSGHGDASPLAQAMERLKIRAIRGSSTRGGAGAMRQILRDLGDRDLSITPDGPQGPEYKIKPGGIYLASRLGREVVILASKETRTWTIPAGWGKLRLPRPFSTLLVFIPEPIPIPQNVDKRDLVAQTKRLQTLLGTLSEQVANIDPKNESAWPDMKSFVAAHDPERNTAAESDTQRDAQAA